MILDLGIILWNEMQGLYWFNLITIYKYLNFYLEKIIYTLKMHHNKVKINSIRKFKYKLWQGQ